ncbi:MAG: trigger factor [Sulfurospirillum sp.]|nr:MAG: trigger factor [Sulfurospirillum sp.]
MSIKSKKIDSANAQISATISEEEISKKENQIAKAASKDMKVDGFRKGKVPVHVVKARYGDKLREDAKNEAISEAYQKGLKELKLDQNSIIGEPRVEKFEEKDGNFELEVSIALRPEIKLEGYKELIPEIKEPKVSDKEIQERLQKLLEANAELKPLKKKRALKKGDFALFDFEGFVDGKPFEGGKAEGYTLEIGSGQFIPGFEDGMVGMKIDEEKDITVTFPEDYASSDLAGKDAVFKVKLHEIQEKVVPADLDDEILKKLLPGEEKPSEELLKEKIKEQLENEKLAKLYQEEIKPKYVEELVKKYKIDLPKNIVEQEMDMAFRNALSSMKEDEVKKFSSDAKEAEKKREEYRKDAQDSVKLTFIVDELAKLEKINVEDQEVMSAIYMEALQAGQDPQSYIKQYEDQGLLPAVKMAIIEDRLFAKLFNEKLGKK